MYVTWVTPNLHFSLLSVRLTCSHLCNTALRCSSCSSFVIPLTSMSSISVSTPGRTLNTWHICFWNTSYADLIPKDIRWKQYLPKGLLNVVRSWLSSSRGICRYPQLASSFEKTLSPVSLLVMSSIVGS